MAEAREQGEPNATRRRVRHRGRRGLRLPSVAQKKSRYLLKLSQTLDQAKAMRAARVERTTVWRWRQDDAAFAAKVDEIINASIDAIEIGAVSLAINDKNAEMIKFLLRSHKRESYGAKLEIEIKNHPHVIAIGRGIVQLLREFVPREQFLSAVQRLGVILGINANIQEQQPPSGLLPVPNDDRRVHAENDVH
jgi:hypothetical protein